MLISWAAMDLDLAAFIFYIIKGKCGETPRYVQGKKPGSAGLLYKSNLMVD